jgi:LAO/AO transport system kinase
MTSGRPTDDLFAALRAGDRGALARAITLVESTRATDAEEARELVRKSLGLATRSVRIGITGIPGAGKSTLIDALGLSLIGKNHRIAVLAIDPSGQRGGSILGDKTRMERLSQEENAFIRPSPTSGNLGGVGRRTRETVAVCEAAGYDRILIETVGTGQNEYTVDRMTDLNVLLMIGGAGDELQGIKRGIMEAADVIALNKTDGGNQERNARAANDLRQALQLLPPRDRGERPEVILCSAQNGTGIEELLARLQRMAEASLSSGYFTRRRSEQDRWWMRATIEERLISRFYEDEQVVERLSALEQAVMQGSISPFDAAEELLKKAGLR